jgi:predicted HTH transcriptional regulator
MNAAAELFETLRKFKLSPSPGKSPQFSFTEYCREVLGGVERVHFDFKSKANPREAKLNDDDIKNVAKAVSGFSNSAGGVLIFGIEDKSAAPVPISSILAVVDDLLRRCHQLTSPAVIGVDGDVIPSESGDGSGFGLIFVPESDLPPHRVVAQITKSV